MTALRWHGRGDLRLEQVLLPPPPRRDQVQLRVLWCGICGTDIEEWQNGPVFIPHDRRHPLTGSRSPLILGHELTGVVVALGQNVRHLALGDRVAVDGLSSCSSCRWCRVGRPVLCDQLSAVGLMEDGGLAEYCNVPAAGCFPMPPSMADEAGALVETLAVGVRALRRGRLAPAESVVVVGTGAVGLLALQAARSLGAARVMTVDPLQSRRDLALALGADLAVASTSEVAERVDLVVECSGNAAAASDALSLCGPAGRLVLVGVYTAPVSIDALTVVAGEREILGSLSHVARDDFATAMDLMGTGQVNVNAVISHRTALVDALGAFAAVRDRPSEHTKVVISPSST